MVRSATNPRPSGRRLVAALGGACALIVGVLTLLGWALDVRRLTDWYDNGISMFPNAAACAAFSGLALLLLTAGASESRRIPVRAIAGAVGLAGVNLGLDTLLSDRAWGQGAAAAPMRMGPPASTSYLLIGTGMLLATCGPRARRAAGGLALVIVGIAALSLVGYLFGADQLFGVARFTGIAAQTSSALAAIGVGLVAALPEHGLAAVLGRDDPGGVIVRRLLLPIVAIPLVLGWFRVRGQEAGYFDTAFGTALLSLLMILMVFALLWWTAEGVSRHARLTRVAEQGVRDSEARHRALVEASVYGVLTIDERGVIESANPAAESLFGYPGRELIGHNVSMLMPEPYTGEHDLYLQTYLRTGVRKIIGIGREVVGRRKDGSTFPMDLAISEFSLGARRHFTGIVRDITEREAMERALRGSERRFKTLAGSAPVGIFETDDDGNCVFVNDRWCEMAGMAPEAARGRGWAEALHPDDRDRVLREWHAAASAGREFGGEYRFRTPRGGVTWLSGSAVALRDEAGAIAGYIGTVTDITARKATEEDLREADHRKDEFLATLSHELRNPLAPLRNAVELVRRSDGRADLREQAHGLMERQLGVMVRLIDDLLDITRVTRGKLHLRKERVDLASVIRSAVEAARPAVEAQAHELTVTLPPEPVYLDADPVRLAQVFGNLLTNAAKYTERAGHIWLTAERQGDEAVVSVRDTGIGIAAEHLPHIFGMFSQVASALERSQGGLGIGLSLVRGLVELHGGRVEARSGGPGLGSEFVVRLPAAEAPVPTAAGPGGGAASDGGGWCRILVVDDNRDAADSLAMMLGLRGHDLQTAYDGLEAVQAAAAFRPRVVLLDIGLPKMSGYDVARHVRGQPWGGTMALIALTGWGQDEDRRRSLEAGFDHHLTKPVDPAALEKLLALIVPRH